MTVPRSLAKAPEPEYKGPKPEVRSHGRERPQPVRPIYTEKAEIERELARELEQYRRMGEEEGSLIDDEDYDI